MPLQDTDPTPSFGGFGLRSMPASKVRLSVAKQQYPVTLIAAKILLSECQVNSRRCPPNAISGTIVSGKAKEGS